MGTDTTAEGGARKLTMAGTLTVTVAAYISSVANPAELNLNGNSLVGGGSFEVTSGSHPGKVLAVGSVEIGNLAIDSSAGQLAKKTEKTKKQRKKKKKENKRKTKKTKE